MRKLVEKKSVKCCTDRRLVGLATQNTRDRVVRMEGEVIKLLRCTIPRAQSRAYFLIRYLEQNVGLPVGACVCLYKQHG